MAAEEIGVRSHGEYLIDVHFYVQNSPTVTDLTDLRSIHINHVDGAYLIYYASEEVEHEDWAYSDLIK